MKNVLVINCGSSSLKYQLINMENEEVLAKGLFERIAIPGSKLTHEPEGREKFKIEKDVKNHTEAIALVLEALTDKEHGVIADVSEIAAVGHRVLHAGTVYSDPVIVTEDVKKVIRDCFDLGPLHNPANLMGIEACEEAMPGTPNVAVFDTGFGMVMPPKAHMYAIPYEYYEKYSIRRYGFHGTSHKFVSAETIRFGELPEGHRKVIVCHLGNGSSISASIDGKCVDTSMGLTPLEGLIMGTRSGDIDPAVVQFIANHENKSIDEILNLLNKKSGVLGLSGVSSDFRDLDKAEAEGNERAGEMVWKMPATDYYKKMNDSKTADIKNSGGKLGGMMTAGLFVGSFLAKEIPWIHVDIAGTASVEKAYGYIKEGATGVMVKSLYYALAE